MSRIIDRQRQIAESGRFRLGLTVTGANGKTRPTRSETWIFTSPDQERVNAAAQLWGGTVEAWQPQGNGGKQWRVITKATSFDAILPPGDPLSQAYEMWSKGGCVRRCDGVTEKLTGSHCPCLAEFGDTWFEQPKGKVCDSKTRLKVLVPDMPGLGSYRIETGSFYATDEIAGIVDFIRGAVGPNTLVPVRVRIEQRTRVAKGETKHFPVPVVELRGVTTGQILGTGRAGLLALGGGAPATNGLVAIGAVAEPRDWLVDVHDVETLDDLRALGADARDAGVMDGPVLAAFQARAAELQQEPVSVPADEPGDPDFVDGATAVEPDPLGETYVDVDEAWQRLLTAAGRVGLDINAVDQLLSDLYPDVTPGSGAYSGEQMLDAMGSLPRATAGAA